MLKKYLLLYSIIIKIINIVNDRNLSVRPYLEYKNKFRCH